MRGVLDGGKNGLQVGIGHAGPQGHQQHVAGVGQPRGERGECLGVRVVLRDLQRPAAFVLERPVRVGRDPLDELVVEGQALGAERQQRSEVTFDERCEHPGRGMRGTTGCTARVHHLDRYPACGQFVCDGAPDDARTDDGNLHIAIVVGFDIVVRVKRLCVFCGSSAGARPEYAAAARALAAEMVRRHIGLVFGGGHVGLMGVMADTVLALADLALDQEGHRVTRGGNVVTLSPTEYKLLRYLLLNSGRVLTRAQILDHVWNYDFDGDASVVETYMSYLRRKIDTHDPKLIHTVRGVGYTMRVEH